MKNVLIAKANENILRSALEVCVPDIRKIKFTKSTKNTSRFNVSEEVFEDLVKEIKSRGYNQYELMYWG